MNEYLGRAFIEDIIKVVIGVFLVGLLVGGFCFLLYVGEQQRKEALAKFDYERLVGVGKDLEFVVTDKLTPCFRCQSREFINLLIHRVKHVNYDPATKTVQTKRFTCFAIVCTGCGKKTQNENHNLADAVVEWETK